MRAEHRNLHDPSFARCATTCTSTTRRRRRPTGIARARRASPRPTSPRQRRVTKPIDLGEIFRPKYFRGGVAVHGSNNIPNYAASHGCVRISTSAMDFIWDNDLIPMRSVVWVHGNIPLAPL